MLDAASISALVGEHGKWLLALLRGLVGNAHDADDAFQEVWLKLLKSPPDFKGGEVKWYLARTARSVVIDRFRRQVPTVSLDAELEGESSPVENLADDAPSPGARFESSATAADVLSAVSALPFNWRQVVLLRVESEMEFKDIAAELGVPLGTVLTWMHRATESLRRTLGGEL